MRTRDLGRWTGGCLRGEAAACTLLVPGPARNWNVKLEVDQRIAAADPLSTSRVHSTVTAPKWLGSKEWNLGWNFFGISLLTSANINGTTEIVPASAHIIC
eukprot:TRINITY_DN14143_c0_g1_i1.p2 TRINITY_DN14143_c0_g1~~TRINITY_DN14143_c0_g1_i1.p2  ORF type:complete len:101 (-),score=4.98 TRINITY_DN14143_c0_g1_i1:1-303(-)